MNPRQRQGLIALMVALGLAVLTLSQLQRYTADVARDVGDRRDVLVLTREVRAYDVITEDDLDVERVPQRWASPYALDSAKQVLGRVAATGLGKGAVLDGSDLTLPPAAGPQEREVSIVADVAASVAGAVRPEDRVDVIAVTARNGGEKPTATVVAPGLRILRVSAMDDGDVVPPDPDGSAGPPDPATPSERPTARDEAVTSLAVTVAVTSKQAAALVLADASSEALRLALLPRGTTLPVAQAPDPSTTSGATS